MLPSLRKFNANEAAQECLRIITFYDEYGEAKTQHYFQVNRKTVWAWKKKLKNSDGRLEALIAKSTRPKHVRRMTTDPRIVAFIRNLRQEHPRIGKEKIKPLLDRYGRSLGIASIAVSTIGKVIRRNQLVFPKYGRIYHDPNSKWAQNHAQKSKKHLRVRYAPKPQELGHWQMDTLVRTLDRLTVYFYSAMDVKGKVAFSLPYSRCTSRNAKDFFQKLQQVYPLPMRDVQTDNGSEFQGELDDYLRTQHIPHLFSYPRCPRINGCIERYQRTLNEEFIQVHEDSIRTPSEFYRHLSDYLVFYNSERMHEGLGKQTPFAYLISQKAMSKMSVTCT